MDTGINDNALPDSLVLHDPITGEPIQKQYDENSIVLDPLTEKQIADQEHMLEMQRLMAQQKTAGYTVAWILHWIKIRKLAALCVFYLLPGY